VGQFNGRLVQPPPQTAGQHLFADDELAPNHILGAAENSHGDDRLMGNDSLARGLIGMDVKRLDENVDRPATGQPHTPRGFIGHAEMKQLRPTR